MNLLDVVAAVQERVSYLRCSSAAQRADGWLPCSDLIADPRLLRTEIDATAAGRHTSDAQVAASLYVQSYAFRLPSIAVAAYALGLPAPSTSPDVTAIRITRSRPGELAITDDRVDDVDAATLATNLFDDHLGPLIAAVRATTRVGERLLWGNVAASIATIFRAVQSIGPRGDPAVRDRADEFFAAAGRWLDGLGHWSILAVPDMLDPAAVGWYFDRTTCCLYYQTRAGQTSGGSFCDDCSLNDPVAITAARRADLVATTNGAPT